MLNPIQALHTWFTDRGTNSFLKVATTLVDLLLIEIINHFSHVKQMYRFEGKGWIWKRTQNKENLTRYFFESHFFTDDKNCRGSDEREALVIKMASNWRRGKSPEQQRSPIQKKILSGKPSEGLEPSLGIRAWGHYSEQSYKHRGSVRTSHPAAPGSNPGSTASFVNSSDWTQCLSKGLRKCS